MSSHVNGPVVPLHKYKQHELGDLLSEAEVNAELDKDWYYSHEDPKKGGGMYKKRKTNKSKKSRRHIKSRSRRPVKSRRYRKSRK